MKRIFSLFLALILCLTLFACGKQPETPPVEEIPREDAPSQDTVTTPEEDVPADLLPGEQAAPEIPAAILGSATAIFKDDSDAPVLQVDVTLPACESLPQIDAYYKAMYDDLTATYGLNREDAALRRAESLSMGQEFLPWQASVKAEITRNDGVTLSLMRTVTEEWPGHESVQYYAETFDVATQGRLLLSDLFQPGADYLTRLADSSEVDQLNFALSDDSLMLCIEGGYRALPLSDLSDILQPQWVTE